MIAEIMLAVVGLIIIVLGVLFYVRWTPGEIDNVGGYLIAVGVVMIFIGAFLVDRTEKSNEQGSNNGKVSRAN